MPKFPTTKIEINGEKLVTRGAKYFIYKGKRYVVKDHLLNLNNKGTHNKGTDKTSEVTEVEKQTGDVDDTENIKNSKVLDDTKDVDDSKVSEKVSDIEVTGDTSDTFKGSKVAYDTKRGDISIEALDTLPITIPEEANGKRLMANETPLALSPESLTPVEFNKDGLSIVTSIIPFVLMAAGFLIKGDKEKKESVNGGNNW